MDEYPTLMGEAVVEVRYLAEYGKWFWDVAVVNPTAYIGFIDAHLTRSGVEKREKRARKRASKAARALLEEQASAVGKRLDRFYVVAELPAQVGGRLVGPPPPLLADRRVQPPANPGPADEN